MENDTLIDRYLNMDQSARFRASYPYMERKFGKKNMYLANIDGLLQNAYRRVLNNKTVLDKYILSGDTTPKLLHMKNTFEAKMFHEYAERCGLLHTTVISTTQQDLLCQEINFTPRMNPEHYCCYGCHGAEFQCTKKIHKRPTQFIKITKPVGFQKSNT